MIAKFTDAYVRRYTDTGQTTAYVEWEDHRGKTGRTEAPWPVTNGHMNALLNAAHRRGVTLRRETW